MCLLVARELGFAVATFAAIPSFAVRVSPSINFQTSSIRATGMNKSHFPEFADQVPLGAADSIQ
jgi:hypothetical protein